MKYRSLIDQSQISELQRALRPMAALEEAIAKIRSIADLARGPSTAAYAVQATLKATAGVEGIGAAGAVGAWTKVCQPECAEGAAAGAMRKALRACSLVSATESSLFKNSSAVMGATDRLLRSTGVSHQASAVAVRRNEADVLSSHLKNAVLGSYGALSTDAAIPRAYGAVSPLQESFVARLARASATKPSLGNLTDAAGFSAAQFARQLLGTAPVFADRNWAIFDFPPLRQIRLFGSLPTTTDVARATDILFDAVQAMAARAIHDDGPDSASSEQTWKGDDERADSPSSERSALWTYPQKSTLRARVPFGPVTCFIGSSEHDGVYKEQLMKHLCNLVANGGIDPWSEADILPGEDRAIVIARRLEMSQFIVLLLSSDYLFELHKTRMMQKLEARSRYSVILPVLLRPVDLAGSLFEKLASVPSDGRFVTMHQNLDEAWCIVARTLRETVESYRLAARSAMHLEPISIPS